MTEPAGETGGPLAVDEELLGVKRYLKPSPVEEGGPLAVDEELL